ncbi:MAG TPA: glycosyltransferase family 4 protein, partial [Terriglobales bacterium]|nr:glycosyltransferase family 4 protein [Terriglobales bacterium]
MLRRVLRFGPELQVLEPDEDGVLKLVKRFSVYKVSNHILWTAWGLLPSRGRPQLPMVATTWLASRLAAKCITPGDIFHGLPGLALPGLQSARANGSRTLIENATLHPRQWQREVLHECEQFGVSPAACSAILPPPLIRRMEREYKLCDTIIVPSTIARRGFEEFGLAPKTQVVWPGVDQEFFSPPAQPVTSPVFRACFVGRIELSKGIAYLLQAWNLLALPMAELVLAGPIPSDIKAFLKQYAGSNVTVTGPLSPREVVNQYHRANIFIHPSPNEGLGLVLLEAMACGLPVIATDRSGAEDCVTHGRDGLIIPARSVNELAEAIWWCFRHRQELPAMGKAARQKVEQR